MLMSPFFLELNLENLDKIVMMYTEQMLRFFSSKAITWTKLPKKPAKHWLYQTLYIYFDIDLHKLSSFSP